ncbi:MAG TPA: poly-gamma-glutamate synthase PgsB [Clostridiales bacterium]|nr:poly-gamma-glutamate synthase PgsB [Clostridiales bacterium]
MTKSIGVILVLAVVFFGYLIWENCRVIKDRYVIKHVVYVNGTRGKSSTTRLIDGGLRAAGLRVFCKTTGTLPMTINTNGVEKLIHRRGAANIREQLQILHKAAKEHADVLVIECMAVNTVYQNISQHRMVRADIGVITNVRLDHTDVMGETLPEIAEALSNTIPKAGILFTAEQEQFSVLEKNAQALGTQIFEVLPEESLTAIDWPENVALALAVCGQLGVNRETALFGMNTFYQRDPYALSFYRIGKGTLFINGLSINDAQSTRKVFETLQKKLGPGQGKFILLLNSRADRASRTIQMVELVRDLAPDGLWLLGSGRKLLNHTLPRRIPKDRMPEVHLYASAAKLDFSSLQPEDVIFAAGHIAMEGKKLMDRIREEGTPDVL